MTEPADRSQRRLLRAVEQYAASLHFAGITHLPRPAPTADIDAGKRDVQATAAPAPKSSSEPARPEDTSAMSPQRASKPTDTPAAAEENREALLQQVAAEVAKCERCPELVRNRTQTVFGTGNPYSSLLFLGEAPGADEDKQGEPFVGRAGRLLTDIIQKGMGLKREDIYICNILRCRPPGNRNPTDDEARNCRQWLDAQLAIVQPKYICCLGSVAARHLLDTTLSIGKLRGKVHRYEDAQVVCTYHPAYLLRNPKAKKDTWEDIKLLMQLMGLPIPQGR